MDAEQINGLVNSISGAVSAAAGAASSIIGAVNGSSGRINTGITGTTYVYGGNSENTSVSDSNITKWLLPVLGGLGLLLILKK